MSKQHSLSDESTLRKTIASIVSLAAAAGLSAALFGGCDGSATQTTNGQCVHGVLVDASGAPVSGAIVKAWPSGGILLGGSADAPAALGETDAQGRYALKDLAAGEYNVFGDKGHGSSSVLIPRVRYASMELDLGEDTLTPPGTIIGKALAGGHPLPGVFCYLPGSSRVAMTDSLGSFALDQVPVGSYELRYVSAGYATARDSSVAVASGEITALAPKTLSIDDSLQPPVPGNLAASLDSASGNVNLAWNEPAIGDLAGFQIELSFPGTTASENTTYTWMSGDTATVWVDSASRYMFSGGPWSGRDTGTVAYRIKAVDRDGNQSPAYSAPVSLVLHRLDVQRTTVTLIEGAGADASPRCRDTLVFTAAFSNPVIHLGQIGIDIVGWYDGSPKEVGVYKDKNYAFAVSADTLVWYPGKIQYSPLSAKPNGMDSAAWFNGGNIAGRSDSRKPDSLQVRTEVVIFGRMIVASRQVLDIRTDAQGCYLIAPAP